MDLLGFEPETFDISVACWADKWDSNESYIHVVGLHSGHNLSYKIG